MKINMHVDGAEAIVEKLSALGDDLMGSAAAGLKKGLEYVVRDAKKACPHDTGELLNSIRANVNQHATGVVGKVSTNKEYAVYVEMGTGAVGKESGGNGSGVPVSYSTQSYVACRTLKSGKRVWFVTDGWVYPAKGGGFRFTRGQPARPYLYPAFKANKQKVLAAVRAGIRKGMG